MAWGGGNWGGGNWNATAWLGGVTTPVPPDPTPTPAGGGGGGGKRVWPGASVRLEPLALRLRRVQPPGVLIRLESLVCVRPRRNVGDSVRVEPLAIIRSVGASVRVDPLVIVRGTVLPCGTASRSVTLAVGIHPLDDADELAILLGAEWADG